MVEVGVWPDDDERWVTVAEPVLSQNTSTVTVRLEAK